MSAPQAQVGLARATRRATLLLLAACCLSLAGCEREPDSAQRKLLIFAAASLRDVFTLLGRDFEGRYPGTSVTFNFAGSHELRMQIEHGARADVFASADHQHMLELSRASRVSAPVVFARNEPVIAVAGEAVALVREFRELPNAQRIVIGTPEVPIGRYTSQLLDRAGAAFGADFRARVEARVVSRELNVRQVLAKVSLGEAQAGVVYRSDIAAAASSVAVVQIPRELNVIAEYPMAVLSSASERELAQQWLAFVLSDAGRRRLSEAGFDAATRADEIR